MSDNPVRGSDSPSVEQTSEVGAIKQHLTQKRQTNKTNFQIDKVDKLTRSHADRASVDKSKTYNMIEESQEEENEFETKLVKSVPEVVVNELEPKPLLSYQHETPTESNSTLVNSIQVELDADEEDEDEDGYYEHDEDYESSEHTDELADLSRQSMVPIHELIAYYQYIQQGHEYSPKKLTDKDLAENSPAQSDHQPLTQKLSNSSTASQRTLFTEENTTNENKKDISEDDITDTTNQVPQIHLESQASSEESENDLKNTLEENSINTRKDKNRIRANVILELINSERDFVKHLKDVVEGYLSPARRHPEIFTGERINTIFSNIEQLYEFQKQFLASLENCINWNDLASSEVGNCFLEFENGFSVYHYYCNNHPNAISELQDLYTKPRFVKFFEACRLVQNMIDISLDGFLLTPIQKICKYPLQLNELLKNTNEEHPDFRPVSDALESMRNCANLANERKRRIEALADIMSFQEKVENWFGPKLSDTSSLLIHSGEVSKMAAHTWSQNIQLHLFDHLLLYSKRDILKRNCLILKGRISMDSITEISDADEYKPKKSFKLFCSKQQRWFIFITRSEKEKDEWFKAFEKERSIVESDESEGFHITDREITVARRALHNRKHSRSARYRHKRPDTAVADQLDIDDANSIMNRTLSLPSCIHPSHVMNFVEDSKVVSTRKKNSSPNSSSKSPIPVSQNIIEESCSNPSGVGWFRKMGSKKLARSQVYNINGVGTTPKQRSISPASNPSSANASSTTVLGIDLQNEKYDQLERRHRNHMVSEEQARLFRLNNDLPSSIFPHRKEKSPLHLSRRSSATNQGSPSLSQPSVTITKVAESFNSSDGQPIGLRIQPLDSEVQRIQHKAVPEHLVATSSSQAVSHLPSGGHNGTYEATVVLSSGRVVRVREDAV